MNARVTTAAGVVSVMAVLVETALLLSGLCSGLAPFVANW